MGIEPGETDLSSGIHLLDVHAADVARVDDYDAAGCLKSAA